MKLPQKHFVRTALSLDKDRKRVDYRKQLKRNRKRRRRHFVRTVHGTWWKCTGYGIVYVYKKCRERVFKDFSWRMKMLTSFQFSLTLHSIKTRVANRMWWQQETFVKRIRGTIEIHWKYFSRQSISCLKQIKFARSNFHGFRRFWHFFAKLTLRKKSNNFHPRKLICLNKHGDDYDKK